MRHPVFCTDCGARRYAVDPVAALRWHRRNCSRGPRPQSKKWPRNTKTGIEFWAIDNDRGLLLKDHLWDRP